MQVDYQNIDTLNAKMTVRIGREDYEAKYKAALQDYRKKASFKGFRKGKTPMGYLQKLFGQEVLTKTVTDLLMDAVNNYLKDHEVPYIGQPLPVKEQEPMLFDPFALKDEYAYSFDVGLLPPFDVNGLDKEIEWYDVPVEQEQIEKEWDELLRRKGTYVDTDVVEAECRVNLRFREMEGPGPKTDGLESTKMVYLEFLHEDIRKEFIGKKIGDTISFDPNHFLKNGDMEVFRRYYFEVNEDGAPIADKIEAQILGITKLQPAEPNDEFFQSSFEPGITTKEGAFELIGKVLKQRNDAQSDAHLRHMIEHQLMDANNIELPYAFIERLISINEDAKDDGAEKPSAESQADAFRWHFIKDKLHKQFNIDVTQDEILRAAADMVFDRFGSSLPYERMREIIERYVSDPESVDRLRSSVADNKLFVALKEHMPVVTKEIPAAEFKEMLESHQHHHHAH